MVINYSLLNNVKRNYITEVEVILVIYLDISSIKAKPTTWHTFYCNVELNLPFSDVTDMTLMGQFMEALNNQTNLDDLNLNSFQGGLECNVDEVI